MLRTVLAFAVLLLAAGPVADCPFVDLSGQTFLFEAVTESERFSSKGAQNLELESSWTYELTFGPALDFTLTRLSPDEGQAGSFFTGSYVKKPAARKAKLTYDEATRAELVTEMETVLELALAKGGAAVDVDLELRKTRLRLQLQLDPESGLAVPTLLSKDVFRGTAAVLGGSSPPVPLKAKARSRFQAVGAGVPLAELCTP